MKAMTAKMVNNQSTIIFNKLKILLAFRNNKHANIQVFRSRDVLFGGLLRGLFREQTIASHSPIVFNNILVPAFMVPYLLA